MDTNNGVVHSILQAKWNQFVSWWRNYFICICMHEAHCILNVTVFTWSHWTNPSPVELFNMQYMCLFLHSLSQTVVCRCCCTLTTTRPICHLSMANISVCSTQPVEPCWVDTGALSYTFCVQKHLSALGEKMLVFLQSLPWVIEGKYGGWIFLLPCPWPTSFP